MLPEEDLPQPEEIDAEEQARFKQGCLRFAVVYILSYIAVGIASTIFSVMSGTYWWVLGWGWPVFLTLVMMIGVSLGVWSEKQ